MQLESDVAKRIAALLLERDRLDLRISDTVWAAATQAGVDPEQIERVEDDGTVVLRAEPVDSSAVSPANDRPDAG